MLSPSSPALGSGLAIGLDLGTSGMKAVALDPLGTVVARASAAYPTSRPEPGSSEQQPADWIDATIAIVGQIRAQTADAPWAVIGLSGMLPTLVTVDAEGDPVGPAITWEDARADNQGDSFREAVGPRTLYEETGQWVDGRYLLPMLHRLGIAEPSRIAGSTMLLGAKDYLFAWLTGCAATDPSTATGFGAYSLERGVWDESILAIAREIAGVSLALPEIRPSTHIESLGPRAAAALGLPEGVPVCLGAADSVLGAMGMGVTSPGDVAYVGGTSTIVLGVVDRVVLDDEHRFLVTPMVEADRWGLEMDLLATGAAFRWLAGVLGIADESTLLDLAARAKPDVPVFLPYVAPGEQGALWEPDLTGTLHGLHVGHTAAEIARALVTGIVLESRRCLDTLADHGFERGPVRVSGGSASDPWFRQQLADATGRTVVTSGGTETDRSAAGAAHLAATAIGRQRGPSAPDRDSSVPVPATAGPWQSAMERHDSVLAAIRDLV